MNKADDKKDEKKDDEDDKGKNPFAKAEELIGLARAELLKASEADVDGKPKAAARHRENAGLHVEEVTPLAVKATPEIQEALARVVKALPASQEETADLKGAVEAIGKAAEGMGMLTANVQQVLNALGNTSRNPGGLPPVFSLAKAAATDVDSRMGEVRALAESGEITWNDVDATNDAVQRLRMSAMGNGLPPAWAQHSEQSGVVTGIDR
jgi:hypothetical protein